MPRRNARGGPRAQANWNSSGRADWRAEPWREECGCTRPGAAREHHCDQHWRELSEDRKAELRAAAIERRAQ